MWCSEWFWHGASMKVTNQQMIDWIKKHWARGDWFYLLKGGKEPRRQQCLIIYLWNFCWNAKACAGSLNFAMAFRCWGSICKLCRDKKPKHIIFNIHLKIHFTTALYFAGNWPKFCCISLFRNIFLFSHLCPIIDWKETSETAVRVPADGVWVGALSNFTTWKTQTIACYAKVTTLQFNTGRWAKLHSQTPTKKHPTGQSSTAHTSTWSHLSDVH